MDEISNALRSLKMPGMAHYWTTMQETRQHDSLSLKDGLQLLIQAEQDSRTTSRNSRLVKKARFRYQASISEVIYDGKRGVDKQKVLNLATCDYVRKGVSVLITGAAGTGKSWLGTKIGDAPPQRQAHPRRFIPFPRTEERGSRARTHPRTACASGSRRRRSGCHTDHAAEICAAG